MGNKHIEIKELAEVDGRIVFSRALLGYVKAFHEDMFDNCVYVRGDGNKIGIHFLDSERMAKIAEEFRTNEPLQQYQTGITDITGMLFAIRNIIE